jgi:hypothetical protein
MISIGIAVRPAIRQVGLKRFMFCNISEMSVTSWELGWVGLLVEERKWGKSSTLQGKGSLLEGKPLINNGHCSTYQILGPRLYFYA